MPRYFDFLVEGYTLYYTSFCVIECMHVHASNKELSEVGSAKFFVKENGDTVIAERGDLKDHEIIKIQKFIKIHYKEMYLKWREKSDKGFYDGK